MMWNIIKNKLPSTIPFSAWKKDKWKAPLDIETRNLVKKEHFALIISGNVTSDLKIQKISRSTNKYEI